MKKDCFAFEIIIGDDYDWSKDFKPYSVTATFYTRVNNDAVFPDQQWTDFPISVLSMWCSNIIENFKVPKSEFTLYFMDGPFYVNCKRSQSDVEMCFINNRKDDDFIEYRCGIQFMDLAKEIHVKSTEILVDISRVEKNVKEISSLEELTKYVQKLGKLIK
jgi:hypothetical protein